MYGIVNINLNKYKKKKGPGKGPSLHIEDKRERNYTNAAATTQKTILTNSAIFLAVSTFTACDICVLLIYCAFAC